MSKGITKNQSGFSLVELMVVVAIIGILAAIAVPQMSKFQAKARQSEAKTQLTALFTAEKAFYQEYNAYHSHFQAVGYSPEGQIRYNVGFGAAPATGAIASASTGYNGGLADDANFRDSRAYCGDGSNGRGCQILNGAGGVLYTDDTKYGLPTTARLETQTQFVAAAAAVIYGADSDVWTINQSKLISNPTSGLQ